MNTPTESAILNFEQTNLDHWSWEGKITPDILFAFSLWLSDLTRWIGTEGKKLLDKEFLAREEFELVSGKITALWAEMPTKRPVSVLVQALFKKGVASLIHAMDQEVEITSDLWEKEYRRWYHSLARWVEPRSCLGLGSRYCRDEESRELIENLVPVLQMARSEFLLEESLAHCRYPQEPEAQAWWVAERKNW